MATFEGGILGGFKGKVGAVVGSTWRGLNVMRSKPKKSGKAPSEDQAIQQERFKLMSGFLSPISSILDSYYGNSASEKSRFNLAMSYHLKEAIAGISPNLEIDFERVDLTKGKGLKTKNATVLANASGIKFSWLNNAAVNSSDADDLALVMVFNPDKNEFITEKTAVTRADLTYTLDVPEEFAGDEVHCWISFVNPKGKSANNSTYLNTVTLP